MTHKVSPSTRDVATQCETWRRTLYEPHLFDDDYVDPTFLTAFVIKNSQRRSYQYWSIVGIVGATIVPQICLFCIIMSIWLRLFPHTPAGLKLLYPRTLSFMSLLLFNLLIFVIGFLVLNWASFKQNSRILLSKFQHFVRVLLSISLFLMIFTPVLKDLTESFSSDTVIALTISVFILYFILYDYNFVFDPTPSVLQPSFPDSHVVRPLVDDAHQLPTRDDFTVVKAHRQRSLTFHTHDAVLPLMQSQIDRPRGVLALNTATLGVVLLASRLEHALDVFAFVSCAMACFSLSPYLNRHLYHSYSHYNFFLFWLPFLLFVSCYGLSFCYRFILLITGFVLFLVPGIFLSVQTIRSSMKGPWDIPNVPVAYEE